MKKILALCVTILSGASAWGQHALLPFNEDVYHQIDRLVIRHQPGEYGFQGVAKPYSRHQVAGLLGEVTPSHRVDQFQWEYLALDNWDQMDSLPMRESKPFLRYFYREPADFFSTKKKDFFVNVNPVVHLGTGISPGDTSFLFRNTRGVEVRGSVDGKVSFYTIMADNQAVWQSYIRDRIDSVGVVPGFGFWKPFGDNGADFFLARGHIAVPVTKHIQLSAGHERQFFGHGYRSMIWSDFAPPSLYLRADTRIWKVRYTNVFTQMTADVVRNPQGGLIATPFTHKMVAFHHLTVNLSPTFQGSVFEMVIEGTDSVNNSFTLNYFNPIIFYRALEQQGGSTGNVLLGLDFKWDLWRSLRLYGQFMLDEFLLSEVRAQRGWWGNKYGAQLGFKYIDVFGVPGLDLQSEVNWARPFTYTHINNYTSATHYWQPMAHPLGANFEEVVGLIRYQPTPRLQIIAKGMAARYGTDSTGSNFGTNLLLNYDTRNREYNNEIGQGVPVLWALGELRVNYMMWHQCFLELHARLRYLNQEGKAPDQQAYVGVQVRWSLPYRPMDF